MKRVIASILVLMALVLAACGGGDDNGDNGDNGDANGGNGEETAGLSVDNLDQQIVLENETQSFENFVISFPSDWSGSQDGFEMTVSNDSDAVTSKGAILAGNRDIPADTILINAQTQDVLQFGGYGVGDATSAEELLNTYLMAFGLEDAVVPYEELDLTAFRAVAVDGVPQFFPPGTVLVAVEYDAGIALYQVVFDGPIATYEPLAREIIANATIDG